MLLIDPEIRMYERLPGYARHPRLPAIEVAPGMWLRFWGLLLLLAFLVVTAICVF